MSLPDTGEAYTAEDRRRRSNHAGRLDLENVDKVWGGNVRLG